MNLYRASALIGFVFLVTVASSGCNHHDRAPATAQPANPTISSISPQFGPLAAGERVTITGANFDSGATVKFGSTFCPIVSFVSSTTLICTTPELLPGTMDVTVTDLSVGTPAVLKDAYTAETLVLSSFTPTTGPQSGGTIISFTGAGFSSAGTISLGGALCTITQFNSGRDMRCQTADHLPGMVDVTLANPNGNAVTRTGAFSYDAITPIITSVSPSFGSRFGGNRISVFGTQFSNGAVVTLGSAVCTSPTYSGTSQIDCTVPSGTPGAVSVTVTNPGGTFGALANGYSYESLSVSSVSPATGYTIGGDAISVNGTGFLSDATVSLGGSACTSVTLVTSRQLTCVTPSHAQGAVSVSVTNPTPETATLSNGFTYQLTPPDLVSISPVFGPTLGGNTIALNGLRFESGVRAFVGGVECASLTRMSSTQLQCVAPAHAAGAASVMVTNPGGLSDTLNNAYGYEALSVGLISPAKGYTNGGDLVTISGSGFVSSTTVSLGGSSCTSVSLISSRQLTCITPSHAAGTVNVVVTNPGGFTATLANGFRFALPPGSYNVSVTGSLSYESVPADPTWGLQYSASVLKPIREVTVELVEYSTGRVIMSTVSDFNGAYSVLVPNGIDVYLRVFAESVVTGGPSWNVQIVDNTNGKAIYTMASDVFRTDTNLGGKNIIAASGWTGSGYGAARTAAPFAILDAVYIAMRRMEGVDANVSFPALVVNWSPLNRPAGGSKSSGEIGTTSFDPSDEQIYVLGSADTDTDEYDTHIIVHEWTHYFEHFLSRSDTLGGSHSLGQRLDPRVAFSEGLGNGMSAILLDDPIYVDTSGYQQGSVQVKMDMEDNAAYSSADGWFSEASVQSVLYDIYDSNNGGADTVWAGLGPIYDILTNEFKSSPAFTTMYTFAYWFKSVYPAYANGVNSLLSNESITYNLADEFDSSYSETNTGGQSDSLPSYTHLVPGAGSQRLCGSGSGGNYNKFMNRRFFFFDVSSSGNYALTAAPDSNGDAVIRLFDRGSLITKVDSYGNGGTESTSVYLSPGTYVGEVYEYAHVNGSYSSEECFDVSVQ